MRRFAGLLMVGALALFVAGGAIAKTSTQKLSGTISKVDASGKTLTVKHAKQETSFQLAPDAKIMSGSKAETLDDLSVGQSVTVAYMNQGSTHMAHRIDVAKAAAHQAAPAKPAATN